jgi:hypothetical protein
MGYAGLYKAYVLRHGAPVTVYANAGCSFWSLRVDDTSEHCHDASQMAAAHLSALLQPGDVVLLPSLRLPRFADQWAAFPEDKVRDAMFAPAAREARLRGEVQARALFSRWVERGARVVLEAPKPIFRTPTYRCVEPYNQSNSICAPGMTMDRQELQAFRRPVVEVMVRLAQSMPGVSVWDPFPVLCPGELRQCSTLRDGRPLFLDGDHVSGFANSLLLPSFEAAVSPHDPPIQESPTPDIDSR